MSTELPASTSQFHIPKIMDLKIARATRIGGIVDVPGDKSMSHRAAIFGALATGTTRITNFLRADDTRATVGILRALGVEIQNDSSGDVVIQGAGWDGLRAPQNALDCGNSGTTMRLMSGVLAGCAFESVLAGDASLSKRPMDRVRVPLAQMGAQISGQGEKCAPPLEIQGGNLHGIEYHSPVASAQVKSAILLAGLRASGETIVVEPAPSRDHTERMLNAFGASVWSEGNHIGVRGGQNLRGTDVEVSGDISSAAFFMVAGALSENAVTVRNVGINPTRTGIIDVLEEMGARVLLIDERESGGEPLADIQVSRGDLRGIEIGGDLIPRLVDELPVIALLATQANGRTVIRDAAEMRVKESDRIAVIARELKKLGANIEERPDGLVIDGPTELVGCEVESPRGDHRIAMTLAIAGLIARGETIVHNADAVSSSFPDFARALDEIRA